MKGFKLNGWEKVIEQDPSKWAEEQAKLKVVELFACPICGTAYESRDAAESCLSRGWGSVRVPEFGVGDFVVVFDPSTPDDKTYGQFGWYDGDRAWVRRMALGLHSKEPYDSANYSFIYVVTTVGVDRHNPHRLIYRLRTEAMSRSTGYRVEKIPSIESKRLYRAPDGWVAGLDPSRLMKEEAEDHDACDNVY